MAHRRSLHSIPDYYTVFVFVVDKMAARQMLFRIFQVFPVIKILSIPYTHLLINEI